MSLTETVYVSYGNTIDLQLLADGSAINTSAVTQITMLIGGTVSLVNTNVADDVVRWAQAGYRPGEIRCTLGYVSQINDPRWRQSHRELRTFFVIYDPTNANGVVFGPINLDLLRIP